MAVLRRTDLPLRSDIIRYSGRRNDQRIPKGAFMKKLLAGLGVVLVLAGAAIGFVILNLDSLAQRVIQTAGTSTVGSEVSVGSVDIDLMNGNATLNDFRVANPEGFSDQDMMRFEELHVDIALGSLNSDMIRINSVSSRNPYVLYELQGNRANLDVVRERIAPPGEAEPPPEPAGEIELAIDELLIEGIQGRLQSDRLPRAVEVNLGDISLRGMEGTPTVIAAQVARPLFEQLSRSAASALVAATSEMLEGELSDQAEAAARDLREQANERLGGAGERAGNAVEDAADELENQIRDIFQ